MRYAFTGTTSLKPHHVPVIRDMLRDLEDGTEFITGCAHGVDTYIAQAATALFPRAMHTLVVPAAPHNEALVMGWMPCSTRQIIVMPPAASNAEAYRARNAYMVARCDQLVGAALHEESRQPRSGTWMTVRMGRKARKLHRLLVLEPEENADRVVSGSGTYGSTQQTAGRRGMNRPPALF